MKQHVVVYNDGAVVGVYEAEVARVRNGLLTIAVDADQGFGTMFAPGAWTRVDYSESVE